MDKWLRNPNVVRIIALLLSVLLWFVVHMESQQSPGQTNWTERSTSKEIEQVGIEVVGLDENRYELVSIEPTQVRVRVSGLPNVLSRVTTQTARVRLDLGEATSGMQQIRLEPVGFPEQVDVEIFPSSVLVVIEEKLMREMPVNIELIGNPAAGLVAGTPTVQPNRVYVTARESGIDEIAAVRGVVDISGADSTIRKQIRLFAYNKDGKETEAVIEPSVVEVEVPITLPAKTMPLQIRLIGEVAAGFSVASVEQTPQDVAVFGNEEVLAGLEFYAGGVVDLTGLSADATVTVDLPKINGVSQVEPATAQVAVKIVPAARKQLDNVRLNLAGVRNNLEAVIMNPSDGLMTVTLEGAPDTLADIGPEDIDLIVDVSNLAEGIHQVEVSYSLPAFVHVVNNGSPATVTVNIRHPDAEETGGTPGGGSPAGDNFGNAGNNGSSGGSGPSAGLPEPGADEEADRETGQVTGATDGNNRMDTGSVHPDNVFSVGIDRPSDSVTEG